MPVFPWELSFLGELGFLSEPLTYLVGLLVVGVSVLATVHAILYKREVPAAIGWVGVIWIAPLLGALAYLVLGVNRIHRRALAIFGERPELPVASLVPPSPDGGSSGLAGIRRFVDSVVQRPVVRGNRVRPLVGGAGDDLLRDLHLRPR